MIPPCFIRRIWGPLGVSLIVPGVFFCLSLLPCRPALGQGVAPVPVLELFRPAERPDLAVAAWKKFGASKVPFPGAPVLVTLPDGRVRTLETDHRGMAWIPAGEVLAAVGESDAPARVGAVLALDGKLAEKSILVTRRELIQFSRNAAQAEVDRGNDLAREGRFREAAYLYRRALELDPECRRAAFNVALAHEKASMNRLALAAYSEYLVRFPDEADDREAVKRKAILLAKGMDPPPPIPARLGGIMEKGLEAALSGDLLRALGHYEAAQLVAPWWAEPYYASGMVYAHMAVQNSFNHAEAAIRCLGNFIGAAPSGDARIKDVRKRIADLKAIREGLNAPRIVPSK